MRITSTTNGIRELIQAFERSPNVFAKHIKLALNQNLGDVQNEAKQNHRFTARSGMLERSIQTKDADNNLSGSVYLDLNIAKYGKWVHDGTPRHLITPTNRTSLRWATGGGFKFAKKVMHPGTKPDEFLYQALERKEGSIQQRYVDAIFKARNEVGL
ncbi:hypothetical protein [Pelosinus sp. sgz500959]|uniref:hypothetical protein n=1 Tax=Pelosinus sp. sgz500959 TaxID=3242472 RepID=UPI003671063D